MQSKRLCIKCMASRRGSRNRGSSSAVESQVRAPASLKRLVCDRVLASARWGRARTESKWPPRHPARTCWSTLRYMNEQTYKYICVCMDGYPCVRARPAYVYTCMCMYTCTHTHTQPRTTTDHLAPRATETKGKQNEQRNASTKSSQQRPRRLTAPSTLPPAERPRGKLLPLQWPTSDTRGGR